MTAIVAWFDKPSNSVTMGADSIGTDGFTCTTRKDTKLFRVQDKFLIGATGSFRMMQLLKYGLKLDDQHDDQDTEEYMVTHFITRVRNLYKDNGNLKTVNQVDEGGNFVVAYNGRLFEIQSDFQVSESLDNYCAIGAGEYHAQATLEALKSLDNLTPTERVLKALTVAEKFCVNVRGPYVIKHLHF